MQVSPTVKFNIIMIFYSCTVGVVCWRCDWILAGGVLYLQYRFVSTTVIIHSLFKLHLNEQYYLG